MVKRWRWFALALTGCALSGAAIYWYAVSNGRVLQDSPDIGRNLAGGEEPITPIPLDLKLDARKVALGKRLFHDPRLSQGNAITCAHCHNLATGGADGLQHSVGVGGKEGKVNTLTVFNSGFNFRLYWDGRAATLDDQVDFLVNSPCEMGSSWDEVIAKLDKDADYRRDFAAVYSEGIQKSAARDAIATFERSLTTPNGKFDRFLRGDKQAIDSDELAGYELFKSLGCISCHQGRNVGGNMYEKLGIIDNYFEHRGNIQKADLGRYNVTGIEDHRFEFRVPSLRNVALTAPYFHDGSAATLEQAVAIMGKYQLGVNLSSGEITRITKFLNTLTGIYDDKVLIETLAIPLGNQKTTAGRPVMSGIPQGESGT